MLLNETLSKLRDMKLSAMAKTLEQQLNSLRNAELSIEEAIGIMVDAEWASRKSNRLKELVRRACYAIPGASLEGIDYRPSRQLDKGVIARLGSGSYIKSCHDVVILGATGAGKTFLACALGVAANRQYLTARYIRMPELLHDLAIARSSSAYHRTLKQYKVPKLLIIDDWLLYDISEDEAKDLLEIVEARHKRSSTIICSQSSIKAWHGFIGHSTIADAICDRLANSSHEVIIQGESMRRTFGIQE